MEPFADPFEAVQAMQSRLASADSPVGLRRATEKARLGEAREQFLRRAGVMQGLQKLTSAVKSFAPGKPGAYTPAMLALRDHVVNTWGITNVGGYANRNVAGTKTKSDHALHRAWDFMVGNNRAVGDAIVDYILGNHDKYGVKNVIWYDRIWDPQRGWRPYSHPSGSNNPTLQHRDHPHVGFY